MLSGLQTWGWFEIAAGLSTKPAKIESLQTGLEEKRVVFLTLMGAKPLQAFGGEAVAAKTAACNGFWRYFNSHSIHRIRLVIDNFDLHPRLSFFVAPTPP